MTKCSERASIYKFAVRCPVCHRKLMTVRRTRNAMPNAEIIDSAKASRMEKKHAALVAIATLA